MAEKLTPQQLMAVTNRGGKLLVSAAAGSGKTKVLVDRLMSYLTDPAAPANIDEFLIITYTKAAASELRGKIAAKLSERIAQQPENRHLLQQLQRLYMTQISTVHSFCGDLLRQYSYRLDIAGDFRVADENECRQIRDSVMQQIVEEAYEQASDDEDFRAFVDSQGFGRDDRLVPEILLKVYDSARCHLDPEGWLAACIEAVDTASITDVSQTVWGRYLMDELFGYLDLQIKAMDECAAIAAKTPGYEKAAMLLGDTLFQLRRLRDADNWGEIVRFRNIDYGRISFPRKNAAPQLNEGIKSVRTACKKGMERMLKSFSDPSERVLRDLTSTAPAVRGMVKLVRTFGEAYDTVKRRRRIMDFSDLEHKTLDLLLGTHRTGPTAIAREAGERFREVMVDEYQDSNEVQDAIYSALTAKRGNCFMVGDVKQSIYQFRLADPGIFLEKYAQFVPAENAEPGQGRKVLLSSNFRSCGAVLSAVNHVFETCMSPKVGGLHYGDDEALHEGVPHIPLGEPEVELYGVEIREDSYSEEAAFTAQRIRELLDGTHMIRQGDTLRAIRPEDIVILLRSPGSVGGHFQTALERLGIRCATGGGTDLLQTQEIGVLRALLQTIHNPRLDIPLTATLASPVFGFTADDLAAVRAGHRNRSMYEALQISTHPKAECFLELLNRLRRRARMDPLTQLLEYIFAETHLDSIYGAMADGETRRENLQTFYQLAVDQEAGGHRDLGRFLEFLDAMEEKGLIASAETTGAGCVTLMSIHKSKGLEFPVVFLCGLSRVFNRESQQAQVLCHKELGIGISAADSVHRVRYPTTAKRAIAAKIGAESLSEELRVLYVAMTRAKDRLIMTYTSHNLQGELTDMVARMELGGQQLLCAEAVCPGEWVLLSALSRSEAGEFFQLAGKPAETRISGHPWLIRVVEAPEISAAITEEEQQRTLPLSVVEQIRQGLNFRYPHQAATAAPSKQTATQRKGRQKDQEAAENTELPKEIHRTWRKPSFVEDKIQGKEYGTALHLVMQYIRYEACTDIDAVRKEVQRVVEADFITKEQGELVDCEKISAFFETEIGKKLCLGKNILREFKFSILDDGSAFGDGLEGEKILLQGVVDCALMDSDGITIIDFKTDRVTEQTIDATVERYRPQVEAYAQALSRIYGTEIKSSLLYFFQLERFVEL